MDKFNVTTKLNVPFIEAFFVGLAAGTSAVLLKFGVEWLGKFRLETAVEYPSHIVLPLFGAVGGFFAGLLVDKVAPETAGSGIPQVKAALNRVRMTLDLRVAFAKLLGGLMVLGSGLFMGREGPTVQLGAAVAASLTRRGKNAVSYRRQLIAAGAGAGLAAAFNAPIAGVVFVMEELLKEVSAATILITLSACGGAALVVNITSHYSHLPKSELTVMPAVHLIDLPYLLLLGAVCAVMGCVFNASVIGSLNFYRRFKRIPVSIKVALAGLCTGFIVAALPPEFHNYSNMRMLVVTGHVNWLWVLIAFMEFFLLTLTAYGAGAPGGLFAPCLVLGGTLGYLIGMIEAAITGQGSPETMALVGMGAFFAGVGRVPLTAITITFEITASFVLVTPLMLACSLASFLGEKILPDSIYDRLMVWNGLNLRSQVTEGGAEQESRKSFTLRAVDVMKYEADQTLTGTTTVEQALNLFRASTLRGLPVVDKGKLVGVITQTDLSSLIHMDNPPANMLVKDIMSSRPVIVNPYDSLEEILFLFTRYKFTWLPVCDHAGRFIGIISQSDVVAALFTPEENPAAAANNRDSSSKKGGSNGVSDESKKNLEISKQPAAANEDTDNKRQEPEILPGAIQPNVRFATVEQSRLEANAPEAPNEIKNDKSKNI
ncbi:MAG TPA: chloride channel protein [Oculatellaceae cyanobacterium]